MRFSVFLPKINNSVEPGVGFNPSGVDWLVRLCAGIHRKGPVDSSLQDRIDGALVLLNRKSRLHAICTDCVFQCDFYGRNGTRSSGSYRKNQNFGESRKYRAVHTEGILCILRSIQCQLDGLRYILIPIFQGLYLGNGHHVEGKYNF